MSTSAQRLERLLALVPYLLTRQGIPVAEAARDAGVSEQQLAKDLELLFVCGLPGHMPDDLIEADWESGQVFLGNADTIARPLRLGPDEVTALLVGLRMIAGLPGLQDRAPLEAAIAKLQEVAGSAVASEAERRVDVQITGQQEESVLATCRRALARRRCLHLCYWVPWRDEATERDVDPMRLVVAEGRAYLEAWCRRAQAVRLFRVDRMLDVEVGDEAAAVPDDARPRDLDQGLYRPAADDVVATVRLAPSARWVPEYYPCDTVQEEPDGWLRVRLRTGDPRWIRALALRLAPTGFVVDPPELAASIAEEAAAALAAYDTPGAAVGADLDPTGGRR